MSASKQWRVVFASARGSNGVVFVDAATEEGARAFFAAAFPGAVVTDVKLEPVDPCALYAPREKRT